MNIKQGGVLLQEHLTFNKAKMQLMHEDDNSTPGGKKLYMSGIFIQGGIKNHNERVYPVSEIKGAVDFINQQISDDLSICGELDHPAELNINLDRVSHIITQMWMDGPAGMGKLQILPTPMGNIVRTLLESGVKLGVSSRGSGNVNESGEVSDFQIVTVDIVARPSAPNAYPVPVYETLNNKRSKVVEDLAQAVQHDQRAKDYLKQELMSWVKNLKN
jgi:hypothetical protein